MNPELEQLVNEARAAFSAALQPAALENEKARYLGKNGAITERLKALAKLTPDQKRAAGAEINRGQGSDRGAARGAPPALAELRLNERTRRMSPSTCRCPGVGAALGHSSDCPHMDARRRDIPLDRFRFRRRA